MLYVFESCSFACILQSGNDFLISIKQVESENRWDNHAWMEVHDITFKIYGFQAWGGIGPQGMYFIKLQSCDVGPYLVHISVIQRFETLNDGLNHRLGCQKIGDWKTNASISNIFYVSWTAVVSFICPFFRLSSKWLIRFPRPSGYFGPRFGGWVSYHLSVRY